MSDDTPRVRCPACSKKYKVDPPMTFKCRECDAVVDVDKDGKASIAKEKKGGTDRPPRPKEPEAPRKESTRREKPRGETERAKNVSEDGEAGSSRRKSTSRRMKAETSSGGEDRSTSRRGRSARTKSGMNPMVYAGIGGAVLIVLVIPLIAGSGGGKGAGGKAAPTGLAATLDIGTKDLPFQDVFRANWHIKNHTAKELSFVYTPRVQFTLLEEEFARPDGAGALEGSVPEAKEHTAAIGAGGTHGGDEEVSIESLHLDDSRYRRVKLAIWMVFEPGSASAWTETVTTNKVEVVFHQPTTSEIQDYVAKFDSAKSPDKKRILAIVARHSVKGFEEFFLKALEDKAPSVSLTAAEYALERQVPGTEEVVRGWKNVKIKDPEQKARLDKLLERVGS